MQFYPGQNKQVKIHTIAFVLMLLVLVVDLHLPLGVAGGVPYVVVIITTLWLDNFRAVYLYAILCTVLTLVGFYLSPEGGELWKVIFNRLLAIFAIWTITIISIRWHTAELRLFNHKLEAEKDMEKKQIYLATMSGAQHITNNLLNGLKLVELEISKHPSFDKEVSDLFAGMLVEANTLMKKLSSVEQIEAEVIKKSVAPSE